MTTHLSTTLQDAAERVMDYDGPAAPVNLIALADALEHAASIAAELEYAPAHSTVTGETETAYPPLVRLLGAAARLPDEPAVTPATAVRIVADTAGELERLIESMRRCSSHGGLVSQSHCIACMKAVEKPWLAPDVCRIATCGCGWRAWLTRGYSAESEKRFEEETSAHDEVCTLSEVTA